MPPQPPQKSKAPWIIGIAVVVVVAIAATLLIVLLNRDKKSDSASGNSHSSAQASGSGGSKGESSGGSGAAGSAGSSGGSQSADGLDKAKSDAQTFLEHISEQDKSGASIYVCSDSVDDFNSAYDAGNFAKGAGVTFTVDDVEGSGSDTALVNFSYSSYTGVLPMSLIKGLWYVCPSDQPGKLKLS